ncbi:MAG: CcoQ/FixQ family Cbb3-type cytochrome c oxidase assembly chaperone [Myxococcaceae bacterium]
MFKQHFADMELSAFPLFALIFFLVVFTLVAARVFFAKRQKDFEHESNLPLAD